MRIVIGLLGFVLLSGCGDAVQRFGEGFFSGGAKALESPQYTQQQQAEHLRGINQSLQGIEYQLYRENLARDFPYRPIDDRRSS